MKKIILAAIASLLTAAANAQNAQPRELNCTEQAITFTVDLTSMWKIIMPRIGQVETARTAAEYTILPFYKFAPAPVNRQSTQLSDKPYEFESLYPGHFLTLSKRKVSQRTDSLQLAERLRSIFPSNGLSSRTTAFNSGNNFRAIY